MAWARHCGGYVHQKRVSRFYWPLGTCPIWKCCLLSLFALYKHQAFERDISHNFIVGRCLLNDLQIYL